MVADDQRGLADAYTRFLQRHFRTLPFAVSLMELQEALAHEAPDALLLDVMFDEENSIHLLPALRARFPQMRIIIHTAYPEKAPLQRVLGDGVRGYLLKDDGPGLPEVLVAMQTVLDGDVYVTPDAERRSRPMSHASPEARTWDEEIALIATACGFSRRLAEVALLRHKGFSEKQIAARLAISLHTAHARLRRIRDRSGVEGLAALVLLVERCLATAEAI